LQTNLTVDLWWNACEAALGKQSPTRPNGRGAAAKCSPRTLREQCAFLLVSPPSPQLHALLKGVWEAILSVRAAWGALPTWGTKNGNFGLLRLQSLALWVVRTSHRSGPGFTIAFLKKASSEARLRAVEGAPVGRSLRFLLRSMPGMDSREGLDQISFLGRALPCGDERVASVNLVAHRNVLTSVFRTDPELLRSAHQYAIDFARCNLGKWSDPRIPCSPSATVDFSRRAGGCREYVRQNWQDWARECSVHVPTLASYGGFLSDEEVELTRYNSGSESLVESAAWKVVLSGVLNHRVCTIPERGWKRRIVSAPPAAASVAGGVLNRALLAGLRKESRTRLFLAGERRAAVEVASRAFREGFSVVSTDLTAATDRLPHDLVRAIVDGLCLGWDGLPGVWSEVLYSLTGPQDLTYPWGQRCRSSRGVLMGLGPSWPIMSIIHLWWVDHAASRLGPRYRWPAWRGTAIGGDDLVGFWPKELVESYRWMVSSCGGLPSKGKDFTSSFAGNFTEMTFWIIPRNPRTGATIRWAGGIPTKGLVSLSLDLEGEAYEAVGYEGGRDLRARRVLRALRPEVWRRCRESGVVPNFPRALGGAGLPPRRGSTARTSGPFWLRLAVGRLLYGAGQDQVPRAPPSWVESRDRVARISRERADRVLDQEIDFGLTVFTVDPTPVPGKMLVSSWLQNETSLFSASALFGQSPCPASLSGIADAFSYSRSVRAWARKRTKGGVPKNLAIKDRRNNRWALMARLRGNRSRWFVEPTVPPEFYFGGEVPT
jgi:hypothetical protein